MDFCNNQPYNNGAVNYYGPLINQAIAPELLFSNNNNGQPTATAYYAPMMPYVPSLLPLMSEPSSSTSPVPSSPQSLSSSASAADLFATSPHPQQHAPHPQQHAPTTTQLAASIAYYNTAIAALQMQLQQQQWTDYCQHQLQQQQLHQQQLLYQQLQHQQHTPQPQRTQPQQHTQHHYPLMLEDIATSSVPSTPGAPLSPTTTSNLINPFLSFSLSSQPQQTTPQPQQQQHTAFPQQHLPQQQLPQQHSSHSSQAPPPDQCYQSRTSEKSELLMEEDFFLPAPYYQTLLCAPLSQQQQHLDDLSADMLMPSSSCAQAVTSRVAPSFPSDSDPQRRALCLSAPPDLSTTASASSSVSLQPPVLDQTTQQISQQLPKKTLAQGCKRKRNLLSASLTQLPGFAQSSGSSSSPNGDRLATTGTASPIPKRRATRATRTAALSDADGLQPLQEREDENMTHLPPSKLTEVKAVSTRAKWWWQLRGLQALSNKAQAEGQQGDMVQTKMQPTEPPTHYLPPPRTGPIQAQLVAQTPHVLNSASLPMEMLQQQLYQPQFQVRSTVISPNPLDPHIAGRLTGTPYASSAGSVPFNGAYLPVEQTQLLKNSSGITYGVPAACLPVMASSPALVSGPLLDPVAAQRSAPTTTTAKARGTKRATTSKAKTPRKTSATKQAKPVASQQAPQKRVPKSKLRELLEWLKTDNSSPGTVVTTQLPIAPAPLGVPITEPTAAAAYATTYQTMARISPANHGAAI